MKNSLAAIAIALVATLALAGCGAATPSDPTPDPVASETPSPTPTVVALPQPVLAVACADIFTDAEASAIVGAPVELKLDETTLRNIYSAAALQSGALSCTWGGEESTDNSWNDQIALTVLPDAEADFDAGVWQVDDGATVYPAGELSEYLCNDLPGLNRCFANVLLDDYWAQALINSGTTTDSEMRTLVDRVREVVGAADEPREPWVVPAGVVRGDFCVTPTEPDVWTAGWADQVAQARAGLIHCATPEGWRIAVLPGGAWSLPGLDAYPDGPFWSVDALEPAEIVGADAAIWGNGVHELYAVVSVDGSAIVLSTSGDNEAEFFTTAAQLLAEIIAAG